MRRLLCILMSMTLFVGCTLDRDDLWCSVTFEAELPDGRTMETMMVDMEADGNFLRNMNTLYEYDIASFVNGRSTQRVLKGMYLISFDSVCMMPDGSKLKVRCADHNSPNTAMDLTDDAVTVTLNLLLLK